MFTSFEESNKDHVIIRELDSTALKLLVDFIYTAQIMVTEENVQVIKLSLMYRIVLFIKDYNIYNYKWTIKLNKLCPSLNVVLNERKIETP